MTHRTGNHPPVQHRLQIVPHPLVPLNIAVAFLLSTGVNLKKIEETRKGKGNRINVP